MRYKQSEIDQLLAHLQSEFGRHGRRASDYLLTARDLLDWAKGREATAPCVGNAIAYCLREAMTGILNSQADSGQSWRSVSREVVKAKQRYERVYGTGLDGQPPLTELLKKIDDMAAVHERESDRERRLIGVLVDRTGTTPVAGNTSVNRFQRTTQSLNKVVHGLASYDVDHAECTWWECLALLRMLFLPDVRYRELDRLAEGEQPSADDVGKVSELVITPAHLRYFLAQIERPVWLDMMTDSGLLDPPDDGEGWPVFVATERLARQYPAAVAHWLNKMYLRLSGNIRCVSMIGDAALAIGDAGLPLVSRIVRRHSSEPDVVRLSWDAARNANPSSDTFDSFVDIVFNQKSSSLAWTFGEIAERFLSSMDASNALARLRLLVSKIASTHGNDLVRSWYEYKPGSIAVRYDEQHDERLDVLIQALMRGTRTALEWIGVRSLLDLIDTLPGMLAVRTRLWFLGNTPEVGVETMIDEISEAIAHRRPNGDDLAVIDSVVQLADPTQYKSRWRDAIGSAPAVEDVGRALAADEPPEEWIRAFYWLPLLPGIRVEAWKDVLAVLTAYLGTWSREQLETTNEPAEGEIVSLDSPFSDEELASLAPEEACRRISEWNPRQGDQMVSARGLSRTLERVVINNSSQWVRHPIRIAMALRHPTYIHRYLAAVRATIADGMAPIDELIRLIALLRTHPWKADKLGRGGFDYDTDWDYVDRATIDLIESLAKEDIGFAGLSNKVWKILESAVGVRSKVSEVAVPAARDPLDIAINLPHTRALGAALEFVAYEFRSTDRIRTDAFRLFAETLRLDGDDGLYHRAIMAPYVGLLQVAPNWIENHQDMLFGSAAPTGLGQKTVDQALKWGPTNKWLMETFRCSAMDAATRKTKNALDHYLIAMLWDWDGYSLENAAKFLLKKPELLSAAGHRLGFLLGTENANQKHIERAIRLWKIMIETNECVEGLTGFGGFAHVVGLDDGQWSVLTRDTLRRTGGCIDEPNVVAERVAGLVPNDTTLEIMDNIVRRASPRIRSDGKRDRAYYRARWSQGIVEKAASELLDRSSDLSGSDYYRRLQTALQERGTEV